MDNNMIQQYRDCFRSAQEHCPNVALSPYSSKTNKNLIKIIWQHHWLVLLFMILATAAAFAYLARATPVYNSTSRIYVEQTGPKIINENEEGFITRSINYLYTQAELLKSTPILDAVLETPDVSRMKTFTKVDNRIEYLKDNLQTSVGKTDDIINISFDSPFPAEAAKLVNVVVDCYINYQSTRKRNTAAEVLKILQGEKTERGKQLSEKFKTLMEFKKQHLALEFENEKSNIILQRLERLSAVLTEAQLATIEARSKYESIKEIVNDPSRIKQFVEAQQAKGTSCVSIEKERDLLTSKLELLQHRRADRLRQLTAGHPAVQALDVEINQVEKRLADLNGTFAQAHLVLAQQEYITAQQEETQIAEQFDQQHQQAAELNEKLTQYALLQSEWEQTKKLCDILDDRIKELDITEDVGALNINILETAHPAILPYKPQKAKILGSALVLGFMLGVGFVVIRDWTDQRIHSAEEISAVMGAPVLGTIPSMYNRHGIISSDQTAYPDSNSAGAETYRNICTALFLGAPENKATTILVTSPSPGDGKTTLASNLAIALARTGHRTLICDADLRKPMLHKIFNINHNDRGISTILAGTTALEETVYTTKVNGLEILPCGPKVSNPSEMLNSEAFAEILQRLSAQYDCIIIDSPQVGRICDVQILAALCSKTLLVLKAEKSTKNAIQKARDQLLSVGAHIFGIVINDASKRNGHYSHNGDYVWNGYYDYKTCKNKKADNKKHTAVVESLKTGNMLR
jgi:succinoglycan biosynthesis transport protein ExoP